MSIFLGLHVHYNASCALMVNGKIVYAAQEERFSRVKNDMGFPKKAFDYLIKKNNIDVSEIDKIAYTTINQDVFSIRAKTTPTFELKDYHDYYLNYFTRSESSPDLIEYRKALLNQARFGNQNSYFDFSFLNEDNTLADYETANGKFREEQISFLEREYGIPAFKTVFLDHHFCHANYSYFSSPFRDEACLAIIIDGWGDGRNLTIWQIENNKLELISESKENDIGHIYKLTTLILGMMPDEHEYKLMGMAPYAKEKYMQNCYEKIKNISKIENLSILRQNRPKDLYRYLKTAFELERFDNIAGGVQLFVEEIMKDLVQAVCESTGIRNIVLGGGNALNVKMNKVIAEMDCVEKVYVPGGAGDEGNSIGGCYALNNEGDNISLPLANISIGFDAEEEIATFDWDEIRGSFKVDENCDLAHVADLLSKNEVVARIDQKAEFGPRALGNRSILANPSSNENVRIINEAIKNRDFWMPFALSILEEQANKFISNEKNLPSKFMSMAFDTLDKNYLKISAGTHPYDRTVRPQLVNKVTDASYHKLISHFYSITNIPALLNTSFNLHGEPVVNSLGDALRTFRHSGIDHLLAGSVLVSKLKS